MTTQETPTGVTVGLLQEGAGDKPKEETGVGGGGGGLLSHRIILQREDFSCKRFAVVAAVFELILIVLFALFADYKPIDVKINATAAIAVDEAAKTTAAVNPLAKFYPSFQDLHVLVFVGFGFLVMFLKKYGYSSFGINFVIAAFVVQFYFIAAGLLRFDWNSWAIPVDVTSLIKSDFAAAAIFISLGALMGKLSPEQYLLMAFLEVIFYAVNEYLVFDLFTVNDPGRTVVVHVFGAYFGLVVSRILYKPGVAGHENESPQYHADMFSALGTMFLWLLWPSLNSIFLTDELQHRAVVNTYFALGASCFLAFAASSLFNEKGKFEMIHIQNATLAGGVAIGAVANLLVTPAGALVIGAVAGVLSVWGYRFFGPCLSRKFKVHDTRGVHFLHGLPGILGALVAAVFAFFASESIYGKTMYNIYPSLKEENGGKTAKWQAGMQCLAVGVALIVALVGGVVTGFLLRLKPCRQLQLDEHFNDSPFWQVASTGECRCSNVNHPTTQEAELQIQQKV